jgi:EAL domain-containing protein (putative c-di-GMP-specific phosphodiesterase class I)
MMSMIELDPPGFQPPRPMAGDEGSRRTVLYGGYTVFSVFQPVFSVSHRRAIGYHASLRAHDEHAQQVPSHEVFTQAARRGDLLELGRLAESLHLGNFNAFDSHDEWLFLSLHPAALMDTSYGDALLAGLKALGLPPQRVVLEVSEQAGGETTRFAEIVDALRKSGFLIALDGFGAKHSNIDRVWNLRPDIVTLDRCILAQASEHSHIERVLPGLVSLLHESGQLVLMGGLSTERDALIALECNVDFVQGAYFAGPSVEPVKPQAAAGVMDALSAALRERVTARERAQATRLAPYAKALETASAQLVAGESVAQATAPLLSLGETARAGRLRPADRRQRAAARTRVATRQAVSPAAAFGRGELGAPAVFHRRDAYARPGASDTALSVDQRSTPVRDRIDCRADAARHAGAMRRHQLGSRRTP